MAEDVQHIIDEGYLRAALNVIPSRGLSNNAIAVVRKSINEIEARAIEEVGSPQAHREAQWAAARNLGRITFLREAGFVEHPKLGLLE